MVEHLTADQEVPGSNLGSPFGYGGFWKNQSLDFKSRQLFFDFVKLMDLIYFLWLKKRTADQEVPGSNSFATFGYGAFWKNQCLDFKSRQIKRLTGSNPGAPFGLGRFEIFKLLTSNQGSI